ncbi:hypothetical protein JD844_020180, partial [Phrynosoma platyrhinos]
DIEEEGAARLEDVWDPRPPSSCNSSLDRKEKALVPYKPSPSASSSSSSSSSSPSSEAKPDLHCLCQMFYSFSSEAAKKVARYAAENILELFLNHVLQTTESECDMFLVAVILATEGDGMHAILRHLVLKIHEEPCGGSPEERERQLQVKVKAIRIIGAIVTHIPYAPVLSEWVYTLAVVVGDFMASEVLSPEGTSPRTYMAPKEIAKIIKTLEGVEKASVPPKRRRQRGLQDAKGKGAEKSLEDGSGRGLSKVLNPFEGPPGSRRHSAPCKLQLRSDEEEGGTASSHRGRRGKVPSLRERREEKEEEDSAMDWRKRWWSPFLPH